jgi:hypothetical protein
MLDPQGSMNDEALRVEIGTEQVVLATIAESEPSQFVRSSIKVTPSEVLILVI